MIVTVWIIGWLFTCGYAMSTEENLGFVAVGGLIFWPLILGVMLGDSQ